MTETVHAPDDDDMLREAVFRARAREEDGGLSGDYAQGSRDGRFRMRPTRLREKVRPEIRHGDGELVLQPDRIAQWQNLVPALLRPWRYFAGPRAWRGVGDTRGKRAVVFSPAGPGLRGAAVPPRGLLPRAQTQVRVEIRIR